MELWQLQSVTESACNVFCWWRHSAAAEPCTTLCMMCTHTHVLSRLFGCYVQVFVAHPGLTRTDHFGKADTDENWSSRGVEAFANSFWGTDGNIGALPLMFACVEPRLNGESQKQAAALYTLCTCVLRPCLCPTAASARQLWPGRLPVASSTGAVLPALSHH